VFVAGAPGSDSVALNFTAPFTFTLPPGAGGFPPGVVYTINPIQNLQPNIGNGEIRGTVAEAVPLPATASVGLMLLAGLGGFSMLRRRRLAVVA
jgi:hypothetical protein